MPRRTLEDNFRDDQPIETILAFRLRNTLATLEVNINRFLSANKLPNEMVARTLTLMKHSLEPALLMAIEDANAGDLLGLNALMAIFGQGEVEAPPQEKTEAIIAGFSEKISFLPEQHREQILVELRRFLFILFRYNKPVSEAQR